MNRPAFIDTNVLVYAYQAHSAFYLSARAALGRLEQEGAELWISRQVLREYLATVTRPGPASVPAMTRADAAAAVEGFVSAYRVAEDGPQTTARLLELVRTVPMGGKQVHDANIAATMLFRSLPIALDRSRAPVKQEPRDRSIQPPSEAAS